MIYFVNEQYLKDKTHITQNVDASDLSPFLQLASETYLLPILGYNFYNDILTKYNANTLSPEEEELVTFITPVVAFYAAYDAIPNLSFRVANKGIQTQNGEYSNSGTIEMIDYVRKNVLKFAKMYHTNLTKYLSENCDKFPKYKKDNDNITKPNNKRPSIYITGI